MSHIYGPDDDFDKHNKQITIFWIIIDTLILAGLVIGIVMGWW
jgi:hypothetical protein